MADKETNTLWRNAKLLIRIIARGGKRRLVLLMVLSTCQAIMQLVSVTSVGALFSVVLRPDEFREALASVGAGQMISDTSDFQLTFTCASVMGLLMVLAALINIGGEYFRSQYAFSISYHLRKDLLASIAKRRYFHFFTRSPSIVLNNLQTIAEQCGGQVVLPILHLSSGSITIVLLSVVIVVTNPLLACIAVVTILIGYAFIYQGTLSVRKRFGQIMDETGKETTQLANEYLHGLKIIRTHQVVAYFEQLYLDAASRRSRAMARLPLIFSAPKHLLESVIFVAIATYLVVLVAAGKGASDEMTSLAVISFALYRLLPSVQNAYQFASAAASNFYCVREITAELELEEETSGKLINERRKTAADQVQIATGDRHQDGISLTFNRVLSLRDIAFRYPGTERYVLDGISLEFGWGQSVGISGPSGAGKSTLVDLLLGLYAPDQGEVYIDDQPLTSENLEAWRASVGYVPQDTFLVDDTITRNVAFGIPEDAVDHELLENVCRIAQIAEKIEGLPSQYETFVGDRGLRLSGGQRQRIALARALYRKPKLLVLDEATSALDNETEVALMDAISALHGKLAIVIVAHRLSTLDMCDLHVELKSGSLKQLVNVKH